MKLPDDVLQSIIDTPDPKEAFELKYDSIHIPLRSDEHADYLEEILPKLVQDVSWVRGESGFICLMPGEMESRRDSLSLRSNGVSDNTRFQTSKINKALETIDALLLAEDRSPGWMDRFTKHAQLGVDDIHNVFGLSPETDLQAQLKALHTKKCEYYNDRDAYEDKLRNFSKASITYTLDNFIDDVSHFVYANWDGFDSLSDAQTFASSVMAEMMPLKVNKPIVEHDNEMLAYRLVDKAAALNTLGELRESDVRSAVDTVFAPFKKHGRQHSDEWENMRKNVTIAMQNKLVNPSLVMPKHFDALKQDEFDETTNLAEINERFIPFAGPGIDGDLIYNLNLRLHPCRLVDDYVHQGSRDHIERIVGALSAYHLNISEACFNEFLKENLYGVADEMVEENASFLTDSIQQAVLSAEDKMNKMMSECSVSPTPVKP